MEERAAQFGQVADRRKWRLVGPMHLADSVEQARRDVRFGLEAFDRYFRHVLPASPTGGSGAYDEILDYLEVSGFGVVGTPDMAIQQIERLIAQSDGGFGAFLLFGHEWADREATLRSYELFARYVIPHFNGQVAAPAESSEWVIGSGGEFVNRATVAIGKATADHQAERASQVGTS
jgi:limonene 1,2-monooxygenase